MRPHSHLSCGWGTFFDGLVEKASEGQAGTGLAKQLAGRAIKTSLWALSHRDVLGGFLGGIVLYRDVMFIHRIKYPRNPPHQSLVLCSPANHQVGKKKMTSGFRRWDSRCKGRINFNVFCFTCRHRSRSHMTVRKPSCGLESWKTTTICLDEAAANDGVALQHSRMTRSCSIVIFFFYKPILSTDGWLCNQGTVRA